MKTNKMFFLATCVMTLSHVACGQATAADAEAAAGWTPLALNLFCYYDSSQRFTSLALPSPSRRVAGLALDGVGGHRSVYGVHLYGYGVAQEAYGLQCGLMGGAGDGCTVQLGVINSGATDGVQMGLFNIRNGKCRAVQIGLYNGPFMVCSSGVRDFSGVQIGIFNYCYRGSPVQIGIINVADQCDWCFQIGLDCSHDDGGSPFIGWHF